MFFFFFKEERPPQIAATNSQFINLRVFRKRRSNNAIVQKRKTIDHRHDLLACLDARADKETLHLEMAEKKVSGWVSRKETC